MKKLSIIIPTYNEVEHLGKCLISLEKQTYTDYEIIVVDDGSTDETIVVAQEFDAVTVLKQEHQGPGAARNLGAQRASGDILVFVDADMTFEQDFLERLVAPILKEKSKGTFSKEEFVANLDKPWARGWSQIRGFADGRMHPADYPDEQPVFRAILKTEFERVGGFDPDRGYDDDWSLSEKLGYQAQAVDAAKFYHYNPQSPAEIFAQSRWLAKRRYKLGLVGKLVALVRASWPLSLVYALLKSFKYQNLSAGLVQLVYDLGISVGLLESLGGGKTSK